MIIIPIALTSFFIFLFVYIFKRNTTLSTKVMMSLGLGLGFGIIFKFLPSSELSSFIKNTLDFIGDAYLSFLKMLVIPLILTSIINAILNLDEDDRGNIRQMSLITCFMLLGMTALASLIGLGVGEFFHVGQGMQISSASIDSKYNYTRLANTLLAMIPSNPMTVMTQNNTIAMVIFAILIGISARLVNKTEKEKFSQFKTLIAALFAITKKLATIVLKFTPYGIFALISSLTIDQGFDIINSVGIFIVAMYVAMAIVFIMHLFILFIAGQNPLDYLKKAFTPLTVAFTTRSSFGTLPVSEETLRKEFKTSDTIATFVPSIGATIGMNACAGIFPAMLVVMMLTILHQPLTTHLILMVMFINAIASLGISGIPGTAFVAATVTLSSLHLPYAIVGLVQGIDPIIDMGRTAVNVNGVLTTAIIVNKLPVHDKNPKSLSVLGDEIG